MMTHFQDMNYLSLICTMYEVLLAHTSRVILIYLYKLIWVAGCVIRKMLRYLLLKSIGQITRLKKKVSHSQNLNISRSQSRNLRPSNQSLDMYYNITWDIKPITDLASLECSLYTRVSFCYILITDHYK